MSPAEKQAQSDSSGTSHVVVIDTGTKTAIADIAIAGDFRFAQSDGEGRVYVSVGETQQTWEDNGRIVHEDLPQRIARLNGPAIAATVQQLNAQPHASSSSKEPVHIDWRHNQNSGQNSGLDLRFIPLLANCANPQGLAVDGKHMRLFLACDKQKLLVLNAGTGDAIASLTTGPGDNVLGYDRERGLVFVANGTGYGSLTIVQQDATTDSYEVIQNLPTRERARTLAVDPSTGDVYLVTDYYGVDLTKPGTIGSMKATPISGSFQVLVVGH
jgi:DNA-binding beta-propeller fold protein YncE